MTERATDKALFPLSSSEGRAIPHQVHRGKWLYSLAASGEIDLQAHITNPEPDDYAALILCWCDTLAVVEFAAVSATSLGTGENQIMLLPNQPNYVVPTNRYMLHISGPTINVEILERYRSMGTDTQFNRRY